MILQRHTSTGITQARDWANLNTEDLKRRAAKAINTRDHEELWALTKAHMYLHGSKGARVSTGTLRQYRTGVMMLLHHWEGENLLRPSRDAGALYARTLEETLAPSTVNLRLAAARVFYRALRWTGVTQATPFNTITAAPDMTPAHEKRGYYRVEEIKALLECANAAETVMVLLGAHAALRISEMVSLTWADVKPGQLRVRGKGGKLATVNLSPRLENALRVLRDTPMQQHRRRSKEFVLPWSANRTRERFIALCHKANIPYSDRAFHGLRHAAATRLYQQTQDLGRVAAHLRHSNIQTTRRYAKLAEDALRDNMKDW